MKSTTVKMRISLYEKRVLEQLRQVADEAGRVSLKYVVGPLNYFFYEALEGLKEKKLYNEIDEFNGIVSLGPKFYW